MNRFINKEVINEIKLNEKVLKDIIKMSHSKSTPSEPSYHNELDVYGFDNKSLLSRDTYNDVVRRYLREVYGIDEEGVINNILLSVYMKMGWEINWNEEGSNR